MRAGRTDTLRYASREFKSLTPAERSRVLERYGNRCAVCGYRCGLEVHHIEGEALEPTKAAYNDPGNLIALCSGCHHGCTGLELKHISLYRIIVLPSLKKLAIP